jgi:hypothetical protein
MNIILGLFIFSISHLSYIFILDNLKSYISLCNNIHVKPYLCVHYIVIFTKLLQTLFILSNYNDMCNNINVELYPFILYNCICILTGQYLNYHVYKTIKIKGVCYGLYLNENIPWVHEFPFNIPYINHPQYVGSWLSYISVFNIIKYCFICDSYMFNQFTCLQCAITFYYIGSSFFESIFHKTYLEINNTDKID